MKYLTMLLALPTLLCAACQNNTIKLEFATDSATATAAGDGGGSGSGSGTGSADDGSATAADTTTPDAGVDPGIAGNWLLAASTVLDPNLPFQFYVVAEEVSPGTFNLTMTSLSLDPGSTTSPRQLVGDDHIYYGVPLAAGADFQIYTGPITIPGAANPISGTDVSVDLLLSGNVMGNPVCGSISGMVTAPTAMDVTGSTFGTVKVADVNSLPTTLSTTC